MLLRECLSNWPPDITISDRNNAFPPRVDLSDLVLNVRNQDFRNLAIKLRHTSYCEYTVIMSLPQALQQKVISEIVYRKGVTLRDVGNLRIS